MNHTSTCAAVRHQSILDRRLKLRACPVFGKDARQLQSADVEYAKIMVITVWIEGFMGGKR
jgi:hypothetical protein